MEHKAQVVLSEDVHKQIKWFTENWDKEIGAVGTVKLKQEEGEKYFYVEKLFFPQQRVGGASVHFRSEDWGSLIKQKGFLDIMGDISFYWHKHPGSASHSQTDEEDTFETFMAPEAKRKFFIFLQTALKKNETEMDTESRIDFRVPVRATILNKDIELLYELPPEDKELVERCEKILETCIIKEEQKPVTKYFGTTSIPSSYGKNSAERINEYRRNAGTNAKVLPDNFRNETLNGLPTCNDETAGVRMEQGQATITAGKNFEKTIMTAITHEQGMLKGAVKKFKVEESGELKIIHLQPDAGKYLTLKEKLYKLYGIFNDAVIDMWKKEGKIKEDEKKTSPSNEKDAMHINNNQRLIDLILNDLICSFYIEWKGDNYADVCQYDDVNMRVGVIRLSSDYNSAIFEGQMLVDVVGDIIEEETCEGAVKEIKKSEEEEAARLELEAKRHDQGFGCGYYGC